MRSHKKLLTLLLLALTAGSLAACNTMAGLGEDISDVGDEIEECAEGVDC